MSEQANVREGVSWSDLFREVPADDRAKHPRIIVCCGGRDFHNRKLVRRVLAEYLPPVEIDEPLVLHGCARGADTLAGEEAADLGFWVGGIEATWRVHGRAAGPIRNRKLLDKNPDLVIAFPGGRGTADMVRQARQRGIPVREVAPEASS